jgi:hypothetical protein
MAETFVAESTPVVYMGTTYPVGTEIPAKPGDLDDLIELGVVSVKTMPDPKPPAAPKAARAPKKAVKTNG